MDDAGQERGRSRLGGDHGGIFGAEAHRKRRRQVDVQRFHAGLQRIPVRRDDLRRDRCRVL